VSQVLVHFHCRSNKSVGLRIFVHF
jgi:hypothetical protein